MPNRDTIRNLLFTHLDALAVTLEQLPQALHLASEAIVQSLLNDGKILACAESKQTILSHYFCSVMLSRYQHERPGLPAYNLSSDPTILSTLYWNNSPESIYSCQIKALAQSNDIVMLFSSGGEKSIIQAIKSAHKKKATCIILTGNNDKNIQPVMEERDIKITVKQDTPSTIIEGQLLALNVLSELIDKQLFGV